MTNLASARRCAHAFSRWRKNIITTRTAWRKDCSTGKTHTIGHITEHSTWQFHARVCAGVIDAAFHDQVHVMTLHRLGHTTQPPLPLLISELIEQRVEGIIIFCGSVTVPTKSVLEMWSHDIVPVLICDTLSEKPLDHIDTDERQLAQRAVDYLLKFKAPTHCVLRIRRALPAQPGNASGLPDARVIARLLY